MWRLIFVCFLVACGSENSSKLKYGTFNASTGVLKEWSAFTTIERNACVLPVQLYSYAGVYVSREQADFVRNAVGKAVAAWTGALAKNQRWYCKNPRVVWTSAGYGAISIYLDPNIQRGYSIVGQNQIYLTWSTTNAQNVYAERVILHEMGHMFGLSDTYTEPGNQQPIGQPAGIMNQLYNVFWLTEDDIYGANALYEYINGRAPFCTNGYGPGEAIENKNQIFFCRPN